MARKYDNQGRALATFTTDSRSTINKRKKGIKVADKAAKTKATPRKQGLLTDLQEKRNMTYQSVKGTMKGKPVNTTGSMFKAKVNSKVNSKPANIKKATIYKPNAMTGSPYGEADLPGKGRRGKPKGNIGKVQQITKDTKLGGMQKIKTKKPKKQVDKLGRSKGVPHYATMMAKKLMGGGTKQY